MRFSFYSISAAVVMFPFSKKNRVAMGIEVTDEDLKLFAQTMGLSDDFTEAELDRLA